MTGIFHNLFYILKTKQLTRLLEKITGRLISYELAAEKDIKEHKTKHKAATQELCQNKTQTELAK